MTLYRNELMNKLEKLDQSTVSPHLSPPVLADGENLKIRVVHDESTFYSNADHTRVWSDGHVIYAGSLH